MSYTLTSVIDGKSLYFSRDISSDEITEIFDRIERDLGHPIIRRYPDVDHFFDIQKGYGYNSVRIQPNYRTSPVTKPFHESPIIRKRRVRKPRSGLCNVMVKIINNDPPLTTEELAVVYNILSDYGVIN